MRLAPASTLAIFSTTDLAGMPTTALRQDSFTRWHAAASTADVGYKCDMLMRGRFDVCFNSAAQIDTFGNLNITAIGDYARPKVRLVGCLAQPEHLAFVPRPIVMMDLSRRGFVAEVDFVTSVGHARGGRSRESWGLPPGGPHIVVTNKAIFDFLSPTRRMRLRSLHPGVSREEVCDLMGFAPVMPETNASHTRAASGPRADQDEDRSESHTSEGLTRGSPAGWRLFRRSAE